MEAPVLVIVGPTASGKSSLAMKVATEYGGEIICADSRTVYKYMDIGTAKPSLEDQAEVVHHGLDLVQPNEAFNAYKFQIYANEKIKEVIQKGKIPIIVGGTGLYIDSIFYNYSFNEIDNRSDNNNNNTHEANHYIKREASTGQSISISNMRSSWNNNNSVVVGIATCKDVLKKQIATRVNQMFMAGVVEEATELSRVYGWNHKSMTGNVYASVREYKNGVIGKDEMIADNIKRDWQLAKRQMTWFQRNPFIFWDTVNSLEDYIDNRLSQFMIR